MSITNSRRFDWLQGAAWLTIGLVGTILSSGPAGATIVQNASFENPTWNTYSPYGYVSGGGNGNTNPFTINDWTYGFNGVGGGAGLAIEGSAGGAYWDATQTVPDGSQFAFAQGNGAYVAQDLALSAGNYALSFWITGRDTTGTAGDDPDKGATTYQVLLNGVGLTTGSTLGDVAFAQVSIPALTVLSTGTYTLKFLNTSPAGDHTFILDNVQLVQQVPEPASVVLLALGGWLVFRLRQGFRLR